MPRRLTVAAMVIVLVAALAAGVALRHGSGGGERLVLTTFPGIDGDLRLLLEGCEGVTVRSLAPPGSDPHAYSLRPEDARLIREAVLVFSTGHAPFEERVREIAPDKTVVITEIPGVKLERLPSGAVNLHMPIYDPENYKAFIRYAAARLSAAIPECNQTINGNLKRILLDVSTIESKYSNVLGGRIAVASSPLAQYAVTWLGADIRVYLASEHGAQVQPQQARAAEELLGSGAIAVVVVDSNGNPIGPSSQYLLDEARRSGAPVLMVEAPYTSSPILEKIRRAALQAAVIAGQSGG